MYNLYTIRMVPASNSLKVSTDVSLLSVSRGNLLNVDSFKQLTTVILKHCLIVYSHAFPLNWAVEHPVYMFKAVTICMWKNDSQQMNDHKNKYSACVHVIYINVQKLKSRVRD